MGSSYSDICVGWWGQHEKRCNETFEIKDDKNQGGEKKPDIIIESKNENNKEAIHSNSGEDDTPSLPSVRDGEDDLNKANKNDDDDTKIS